MLKARFQVQKGVVWVSLRSRCEIVHVVIWQLKHTSVLRARAPRTQPIFRMHQTLGIPGVCAERLGTGCIRTPLGVQVWISSCRYILLLLIALRVGGGAQSVLQCSAASRTHTPLGPDSEVYQAHSLEIPGGCCMGQHLDLL